MTERRLSISPAIVHIETPTDLSFSPDEQARYDALIKKYRPPRMDAVLARLAARARALATVQTEERVDPSIRSDETVEEQHAAGQVPHDNTIPVVPESSRKTRMESLPQPVSITPAIIHLETPADCSIPPEKRAEYDALWKKHRPPGLDAALARMRDRNYSQLEVRMRLTPRRDDVA
jgi:hypothetical protein